METSNAERPRRRPGRPEQPIARSELVRIAREQFAVHGYDGVSMAEIASLAGLQKSSLFHHFPTKAELYRASLESVIVEAGAVLVRAMENATASWSERLDAAAAATTDADADPCRARLLLREFMTTTGNREGGDAMQTVFAAVVRFYEDGAAAGAWPAQDFRQLVMSHVGVHLVFFGLPEVSGRLLGVESIFTDAVVADRKRAVMMHVRCTLGLLP